MRHSYTARTTHFHPLCHRCLGDLELGTSHCPRCRFQVAPSWRTLIVDSLIEHAPEIYCGVVLWITVMTILVYLSLLAGAGFVM